MSNHFHILLEVPPMPEEGLSDEELLHRVSALYGEGRAEEIRRMIERAGSERARSEFELPPVDAEQGPTSAAADRETAMRTTELRRQEIRDPFTRRMHDLSEFMKALLERFTRWFNRKHSRSGHLWEDRFKSVIVESGTAARTIAAYIDLNPVRAGIVSDPADYRWSGYGEAVGGGAKGNGKKAREGLVRAFCCDRGVGFESEKWREVSRLYRRLMGLALERNAGSAECSAGTRGIGQTTKNSAEMLEDTGNETALGDLGASRLLHCRIRYFTDGAVIGSREFVNEAFVKSRERFGPKRKDGARPLKGMAAVTPKSLWSLRDLRKGII